MKIKKKQNFFFKFGLLAVTALFLCSCTSLGGVKYTEPHLPRDKAAIYVYRPSTFVGGAVVYPIFINNKKVTTLPHTAYYAYFADPGSVFVTARTPENEASVKLNVKAGKEYYIKGGTATGHFSGRATLHQVHPEQGAQEIKKCAYYPAHDELKK